MEKKTKSSRTRTDHIHKINHTSATVQCLKQLIQINDMLLNTGTEEKFGVSNSSPCSPPYITARKADWKWAISTQEQQLSADLTPNRPAKS